MEEDKNQIKLLLIGGSAGSLGVLLQLLPVIRPGFGFAVVVVLHRKAGEDNTLEELLAMKSAVPVVLVEDKTPLLPGHMYVAPADYHLLFETSRLLSLDVSPKVNYSRPSIDVSFESAAWVFGNQVTAILLSGANADGTAGMIALQKAGATLIIQDPESAEIPFMPQNAIDAVTPRHILSSEAIAAFVANQ